MAHLTVVGTTPKYAPRTPAASAPGYAGVAISNQQTYRGVVADINTWSKRTDPITWETNDEAYSRVLPTWALDSRGYFPNTWFVVPPTLATPTNTFYPWLVQFPTVGIPITGSISGKTREKDGDNPIVTVPNKQVALIYRPSGKIIMQTRSDANGQYTFSGLEPGVSKYVVLAINDDDSGYDAVAHDQISPV